jgi:histidinol-phosphate aminotransferase
MPKFRAELSAIAPYEAGRPIADVARELASDPSSIIKLASNESPLPPFPQVVEAITGAASGVNRYPDNGVHDLSLAVAANLGVEPNQLWFGGGTSDLLRVMGLAVGGANTSAVYAWPSFIIYRLGSILAGSRRIEIPLTADLRLDLPEMAAAIEPDTTIAYVCNPNNPTGTHNSASSIVDFVDAVPEQVLVVIDEAYHDYVAANDYTSAIPLALERDNVLVTRTFSKVYGLAALRVGYAVGRTETLLELRKAQAPFTVSSIGQVAAREALRHPGALAERVQINAEGRQMLLKEFEKRDIEHCDSQANFVFFRLGTDTGWTTSNFLAQGVIIRGFEGGWVRATVGTEEENLRFLEALDQL